MSHRFTALQLAKKKSVAAVLDPGQNLLPPGYPLSPQQIAEMEKTITGKIVFPWSKDYDNDRQEFDDLYPTYPVVIVYAKSITDIRECLKIAKDADIQVAIRSSGHSLACYSVCPGMVIDLSDMKNIYVNKTDKTALIESGACFADLYPLIEPYGLHTPTGDCPTVCPSGFMMGGGYGMTTRMFGMGCDNVLEVTVMLASGKIVVANKDQNNDLFWAIRGGTGGNFGVLLSTKFQLHDLGNIYGVQMRWEITKDPTTAAKILFAIQEKYLKPGVLPQLGIQTILSSNDAKVKTLFFCATWIGDKPSFDQALKVLTEIDGFTAQWYYGKYSDVNNEVLNGTPDIPDDIMGFSRSRYISRALAENDWYSIVKYFYDNAPNQYTMIDMEGYGGNVSLIPEDSCAFIHRHVNMDFFTEAFFNSQTHDRAENQKWTEDLFTFMQPYTSDQSYQNYPFREQLDFRTAYWGKYYNQLVAIKNKYDPEQFFHYQQSISPIPTEDPSQIILFNQAPIVYESY